jgi:hypothetical protein
VTSTTDIADVPQHIIARNTALRRFSPWSHIDRLKELDLPAIPCWEQALLAVQCEVEDNPRVRLCGGHFWAPDPVAILLEDRKISSNGFYDSMLLGYMRLHKRLLFAFRKPAAVGVVISVGDEVHGKWSTCLAGRLWKTWLLAHDKAVKLLQPDEPIFLCKDVSRLRRAQMFLGALSAPIDVNTSLPPKWWDLEPEAPFNLDARGSPELIFELCNVNFSLEFRALDAALTGGDPVTRVPLMCTFLGDNLGIHESYPTPLHVYIGSGGERDRQLVHAMGRIMRDWKVDGQSVLSVDDKLAVFRVLLASVKEQEVCQLKFELCKCYCRAFVRCFDRAPILPCLFLSGSDQ